MKLLSMMAVLIATLPINAMVGWERPIPTLKKLAEYAVAICDKKDELVCPKEVNDEISWMIEYNTASVKGSDSDDKMPWVKYKKDLTKIIEASISNDNDEQIDFLLYKKAYLENGYRVPGQNILDAVGNNNIARVKKWLIMGANIALYNLPQVNILSHIDLEMKSLLKNNAIYGGAAAPPLVRAVNDKNNIDEVKRLLLAGAYVNIRRYDGRVPLHIALEFKHLEIAEKLIESGADITRVQSPLILGFRVNKAEVDDFLRKKKINIETI